MNFVRGSGILVLTLSFNVAFGQSPTVAGPSPDAPDANLTPAADPASSQPARNFGTVGIGIKGSLLGGGVEAAVSVTRRTNIRGGFNLFSYSRGFDKDGVDYNGQLSFQTIEAHYDVFPFAGSFRVSPGVLIYAGTPITATAAIPGGRSFSLGGKQYYSDTAVPVTGSGSIQFDRTAPMATIGWGNLVSRKETQHFSVPVELGVAFQGSPKAALNLAGNVCQSPGVNCRSIASDSTVQANILSEQTKLNNSMSLFKTYPIVSVGFGYKF
jgi:hypothetical protein